MEIASIAGLLRHSDRGVAQGYVRLDAALIVAADRMPVLIAELLDVCPRARDVLTPTAKTIKNVLTA